MIVNIPRPGPDASRKSSNVYPGGTLVSIGMIKKNVAYQHNRQVQSHGFDFAHTVVYI
jgi:hypothetical protein